MKRFGWLAVALLAAAVGAWVGSRAYRPDHPVGKAADAVKMPVGEVSAPAEADELPTTPGLITAATIPEQLPPFTLGNDRGKATSIGSWQGRSLIINFWATWCAPCQREIPLLQAVQTDWAGRGYTVLGIAVDFPDQVRSFAARHGIHYPLLVGEQDALDVAASLGVTTPAFPFTVFTDRRGRIVAVFLGELHKPQVNLILSTVEALNRDGGNLPAARERIAAGLRELSKAGPG